MHTPQPNNERVEDPLQFVDIVTIDIASGHGGNGTVAWRREKYEPMGGPAGGDGGLGGNIYIVANPELNTLLEFQYKSIFKADDGENGRTKNQHGRNGKHLTIEVPCGTVVRDAETGDAIADLTKPGDTAMVAEGGRGGRGNARFSSSRRQSPQFCEPGEPGVERKLTLELKLIADIGIIGLPNAGKSTLISVLSAAKPKIANYAFTTLTPNLGVVRRPNGDGVLLADIPGLIEGASDGLGLGHDFLRHVERTRLLLHLVDISTVASYATVLGEEVDTLPPDEQRDPWANFELINRELAKYSEKLAKKPQLVVLTKTDAITEEIRDHWLAHFKAHLPKGSYLTSISSVSREGLEPLREHMLTTLDNLPVDEQFIEVVEDLKATNHDDSEFEILPVGAKEWEIVGGKVERLIRTTDPRNMDAVHRMWNIYKAMGVFKALRKAGAQEGDTIIICGDEFEYAPDMDYQFS